MGGDGARTPIFDTLLQVVRDGPGESVSLGALVEALDQRAFGLLMLMLSVPMALPLSAIPGLSTIFGVPLCIIAAQLALGFHRPRLPRSVAARQFRRADLARNLERARPWFVRIERVVHRRWDWLTGPTAERLIGAVCIVLAIIMALPIIGGNQPPGIAISLFAIGILGRDGLFVALGVVGTVASFIILAAVVAAFGAAAYFVVIHLFQ
jgi:hypothetical protein